MLQPYVRQEAEMNPTLFLPPASVNSLEHLALLPIYVKIADIFRIRISGCYGRPLRPS